MRRAGNLVRVYSGSEAVSPQMLQRFLRLDVSTASVRQVALEADPRLAPLFERFAGLRILRQEPVECLLSFVCAVATSISRIRWSIEELTLALGSSVDSEHRAFPTLAALAEVEPERLRVGAMEFRCRSLSRAARDLQALGGERFLREVCVMPYEEAAKALTQISGVGRKIADCALLFSLEHDEAFPLDTHTWRVAQALYGLPGSSRTPAAYQRTSQVLRDRFGPLAGWIQQYLYLFSLTRPPHLALQDTLRQPASNL